MRTPLIAGNWKMYKTAPEAAAFVRAFLPRIEGVTEVDIAIAPPFTAIQAVAELARGSKVRIAAQNIHPAAEGAYTGEISPGMLKEAGASLAIIGHSERRQLFGETDASVNRKALAALAAELVPIVCIGETLQEREAGNTFAVVESQLRAALSGIPETDAVRVVVAYEPVWAIGTGRTATPEQAQEVHARLRSLLADVWGAGAAGRVRILYGGSVKPDNIRELMAKQDVDGGLVGGASLSPESFSEIVKFR